MHGGSFFENLTRDLYCFVFFVLFNRSVLLSLSESSLFSSEFLMYPCYLGLYQPWLSEVSCSLYSQKLEDLLRSLDFER